MSATTRLYAVNKRSRVTPSPLRSRLLSAPGPNDDFSSRLIPLLRESGLLTLISHFTTRIGSTCINESARCISVSSAGSSGPIRCAALGASKDLREIDGIGHWSVGIHRRYSSCGKIS